MRTALLSLLPTALAAVHTVKVGDGGLTFDPKTLSAAVGDTVIFTLYPQHDVAQSDFSKPCEPKNGGFYSGTFQNSDNGKKKFVMNVTSTDPMYYYCSVQSHCEMGMVGGINIPSSGDTIDAYTNAAKTAKTSRPQNLSGGQLQSDDDLAKLTASAGSPTASASGSSGSSAATTSAAASGSAAGSASASPSPSNAANAMTAGDVSGVMAGLFGLFAYLL